jgi:hypothetical protein
MRDGMDAHKRTYDSLYTEQPSEAGVDDMLIDTNREPSAVRSIDIAAEPSQGRAEVLPSPAELANPMLIDPVLPPLVVNNHTLDDPLSYDLLNEPISYDPIRHIDMNTVHAPRRFYRTFWRGLTIRILSLST